MKSKLWGIILLILLSGVFIYGLASSYFGYFLPPLQKSHRKYIRQGSYSRSRYHRHGYYRGYYMGGSFGRGK